MTEQPHALGGDDLRAYESLHSGCVVFSRDDIRHLEFSGAKAADALTGLVTNDVLALQVGEGQYAAALTAKGRMVADLRIVRTGEQQFLTSTGDLAWTGWHDIVRKYVNPRLARYSERAFHTITFAGDGASSTLAPLLNQLGLTTAAPELAELRAHAALTAGGEDWQLIASPDLGDVPAFDLLCSSDLLAAVTRAVQANETIVPGTPAAWETARIEAGRPRFGADMNDTTIPQEANLGDLGALSFEKGCYTGQETVARVHFRGHVNRHLRLLSSSLPLTVGAQLQSADGKAVGEVRSSVVSPRQGPLAIAMIRRELAAGNRVLVDAGDSEAIEAQIVR